MSDDETPATKEDHPSGLSGYPHVRSEYSIVRRLRAACAPRYGPQLQVSSRCSECTACHSPRGCRKRSDI